MENPYGFGGYFSYLMGGQSMSSVIPYKGEAITPQQIKERYKIAHRPSIFRGTLLPQGTIFDKKLHQKMFPSLHRVNVLQKGIKKQLTKGRIFGAAVTLMPGGGLLEPGMWKWTKSKPATLVKKGARQSLRIFGPIGWVMNAALVYEVARSIIPKQSRGRSGVVTQTQMTRVRRDSKRRPSAIKRKGNRCPNGYRYDPIKKMCVRK